VLAVAKTENPASNTAVLRWPDEIIRKPEEAHPNSSQTADKRLRPYFFSIFKQQKAQAFEAIKRLNSENSHAAP
jgi:hypothetical protein